MKILTPVNPEFEKLRVVGIASSQGCSNGATYTTSLESTDEVTETYAISDTHGKSFTFNTEISVTAEGSAKFLGTGGSISTSVAQSFGGSTDYSKSETKATSTGHSTSAGQSLEYTGPGAALVMANVKQYKFKKTNLDVEYSIRCEDGVRYKERSKISLSAETYGQTHFSQRHAIFNPNQCTRETARCIDNVRGEKALTGEEVLDDFSKCIDGKGQVSK